MMAPTHGGDVEAVARAFGVVVHELLDFSASINPLGPPQRVIERLRRDLADTSLLARYPDPNYPELREALEARLKVPQACLAIGNGSAGLLRAVVQSIAPRTCLLPTPAFSEQGAALEVNGCGVERFPLSSSTGFQTDVGSLCAAVADTRPDLLLVTNPHNPSGTLIPRVDMLRLAERTAAAGCQLVIDEAFIDFVPGASVTPEACCSEHLIVLRSLTKFYGMPALRVGYAVSAPARAALIAAHLPTWPVTTLAANAAAEAVQDEGYARETIRRAAADRQCLRDRLSNLGIETFESAGNFLLLRLPDLGPDSTSLRAALIAGHHIIVRDCRSFEGMENGRFVRVAVRTAEENIQLVDAIGSLLHSAFAVRGA
jgi:threonine-phosphate decarboxylase